MRKLNYDDSKEFIDMIADTIGTFILNSDVEDGITEDNYYFLASEMISIFNEWGIQLNKDYILNIARNLWALFEDVPMNPKSETIDNDWYCFPRGTHREEIWHWFEDKFKISVAKDLMYRD